MHIAPEAAGGASGAPRPDPSAGQPVAVRDWLQVQQTLLLAEKELACVAERYVRGEVSAQELDAVSAKAVALRELSLAVLQRLRKS
jgi:hypothetical protein